jgi:hypothetical protein
MVETILLWSVTTGQSLEALVPEMNIWLLCLV